MRVKRGTLPSAREGGRLYILLNTEPTPEPERPHDRTNERTNELIATLRDQLEAERQAHAEARRLLMAALERIPPQLEAPAQAPASPEARESPVMPSEAQEGRGNRSDRPGTHSEAEGAQRPWWRRVFGG